MEKYNEFIRRLGENYYDIKIVNIGSLLKISGKKKVRPDDIDRWVKSAEDDNLYRGFVDWKTVEKQTSDDIEEALESALLEPITTVFIDVSDDHVEATLSVTPTSACSEPYDDRIYIGGYFEFICTLTKEN